MRLTPYFRSARSKPLGVTLKKLLRFIRIEYRAWKTHSTDRNSASYSSNISSKLVSDPFFKAPPLEALSTLSHQILDSAQNALDHRFDVLGSGSIIVQHGITCPGVEGHLFPPEPLICPDKEGKWLEGRINSANLSQSQQLWNRIDSDYRPIDWHLDFKSGFRWSESTWYRKIEYAHQSGIDIKIPWELSRMQHLPQLAWAASLSKNGESSFQDYRVYLSEYKNQVLDFIATNPPRFGVNWMCPMDIGIRLVNWLVTRDMFLSQGLTFDANFEAVLSNSIIDHAKHILNNLEWNLTLRTNHYLANLAGLLFAAAYLNRTDETDAWLAFSVEQLIREMELQFNPDGSNFEASTSYHRLSGEMVAFSIALIFQLPEEKLNALECYDSSLISDTPRLSPSPQTLCQLSTVDGKTPLHETTILRLFDISHFSKAITKPDGQIAQIGDNDSGRLIKLTPGDNDILNHQHLIETIDGLTRKNAVKTLEGACIQATFRTPPVNSALLSGKQWNAGISIGSMDDWKFIEQKLATSIEKNSQSLSLPFPGSSLLDDITIQGFPDFGLYIYRSKRLFLSIRCGPVGQNENGGHAHNDQLSIELSIDGKNIICDPGSYLYTPLPDQRNRYRSVTAHFVPQINNKEPNPLNEGLFFLPDLAKPKVLFFDKQGFIGTHQGYGDPLYRKIQLFPDRIEITDHFEGKSLLLPFSAYSPPPFSPSYGKFVDSPPPIIEFLKSAAKIV